MISVVRMRWEFWEFWQLHITPAELLSRLESESYCEIGRDVGWKEFMKKGTRIEESRSTFK